MKVPLCLYLFGLVLFSNSKAGVPVFNDTQLATLQALATYFCPGLSSVTCSNKTAESVASPCCGGCSCHETCGLHGDCCYQEDDKYKLSEQGILKCLQPHTSTDKHLYIQPMYLFTVGPPDGGCDVGSCIYPEIRVPWRNFSPVFSRKKKMNYITEECAKCHGAEDVLKWQVVVISKPASAEFDLEALIQVLQNSHGSRLPYVLFTHPGNASEKSQGTCTKHMYKYCQQTNPSVSREYFRAELQPLFPQLTIAEEDVQTMCTQGPLVPILLHGRVFRNFFCLICIHTVPVTAICGNLDLNSKYFQDRFSMIIDMTDIGAILEDGRSTEKLSHSIACKKNNKTSCRPVLCPTSQRRNADGECVYVSKKWYLEQLLVVLNLTTVYPSHVNNTFANYTEAEILEAFYTNTPWPKCWKLVAIGHRSYQVREGHVIEFLVEMACDAVEVIPQMLMTSFQKALSKFWVLQTNTTTLTLNQQLQRHGELTVEQNTFFKPLWHKLFLEHQPLLANVSEGLLKSLKSPPIWKALYQNRLQLNTYLLIPKHCLCPLVELRPSEYEVTYISTRQAVIETSEKLLFENEFSTPKTGYQTTVRICLEDSDLEMISNAACGEFFLWQMSLYLTLGIYIEWFLL